MKIENLDNMKVFLQDDKYNPTGNECIGYPQLCIRTNRIEERTDFNQLISLANNLVEQYPIGDPIRKNKLIEAANKYLGSGVLGHSWIVLFKSDKKGDYTTYGYHYGIGYVKNGSEANNNDSPERKFHLEHAIKIDNYEEMVDKIENEIIPALNFFSTGIGYIMGNRNIDLKRGYYNPINNCTWFSGTLWNLCINKLLNEPLKYGQKIDGKSHAKNWVMPYLSNISVISDPGMLAETLADIQ